MREERKKGERVSVSKNVWDLAALPSGSEAMNLMTTTSSHGRWHYVINKSRAWRDYPPRLFSLTRMCKIQSYCVVFSLSQTLDTDVYTAQE